METTVCINKQKLVMEVDTGAALSLISEETYSSKFSNLKLKPTDVQLRTYSGELISVLGSLNVNVEHESQTAVLPLLVVKGNGPSLLGRNWLYVIRLNWNNIYHVNFKSSIEQLSDKYPKIFKEEIGLLQHMKAKIHVATDARPKFYKPQSVLYYLREKVEKELQRLQNQGIIYPVTFSEWAAPIVPVLKPDGNV